MSTEQINAIAIIAQQYKYKIPLKGWYSLIFVSKEVLHAVKRFLGFGFTINDQRAFSNILDLGIHALYYASNRRLFELTFREVGYRICHESCRECGSSAYITETPFTRALQHGTDDELKKIISIGLTKRDTTGYYLPALRAAIYSLDKKRVSIVINLCKMDKDKENFYIVQEAMQAPDTIVEECLDLVSSMGIEISQIPDCDKALSQGLCSKKALMCLRKKGMKIRRSADVIKYLEDELYDNPITAKYCLCDLSKVKAELETLRGFAEFRDHRRKIDKLLRNINQRG